jgi:hypothetical protein
MIVTAGIALMVISLIVWGMTFAFSGPKTRKPRK